MPEVRVVNDDYTVRYIYVPLCPKCLMEWQDSNGDGERQYWLVEMDKGNHCDKCGDPIVSD